ncbi:MAG: hypothetical protein ABH807_00065 [Candidatus Shapirobacteria bacterium]
MKNNLLAEITNPALPKKLGQGGAAPTKGAEIVGDTIARLMSTAFIAGGIVLLAMLVWAAIDWIGAAGEENRLKAAKNKISNAIIGFVILVSVRAVLGFLAGALEVSWLDSLKITWPSP